MDESAAAVAEPAHERAIDSWNMRSRSAREATVLAPLPGLLDPRAVRAELSRRRRPDARPTGGQNPAHGHLLHSGAPSAGELRRVGPFDDRRGD
jgi:hypothetical protein